MQNSPSAHYSAPTKFIHWLTAILVLVAFIFGPGGPEERVYSTARDFERQLHETLGLCVLALALVRIAWQAFDKHPEPPSLARWMTLASNAVQMGLIVLLFVVPLSAVTGAWLEGHALTLLGAVTVPSPLPEWHAIGAVIGEVHGLLGDLILWLAGAHAAAGLFHHYLLRDDVLRTMLPKRISDML